jgi:hypothetical protein
VDSVTGERDQRRAHFCGERFGNRIHQDEKNQSGKEESQRAEWAHRVNGYFAQNDSSLVFGGLIR